MDQRLALAREIEAAARTADPRVISATAGVGDAAGASARVTSNGFEGETESTLFYAGAEVTVGDGAGGRPEDWDYATVRFRSQLPAGAGLGANAARMALAKIGQAKVESGLYDMVVDNRVGERLVSLLLGPMQARALQQKSSYLDGMIGKSIGSTLLTLTDDPFIPRGLASRLFDDEGISARPRVLVDQGVLREYFVDDYYGRKLGMAATTGSPSNLILAAGRQTGPALLAGVNRGIYVTSFLGGNSNPTTGDFSLGVSGMLIESGKLTRPVNEMNLSGNLREFWNRLSAVGNDPYLYSAWKIPTLLFTQADFSGA
jgi:PmbA protein